MSAYMIATITVKDPGKFKEYLAETQKVAAPFGAELLFRGRAEQVLSGGEADHGIAVVVKFPSLDHIRRWYGSDAYQSLIPLRHAGTDMTMMSYEVVD